MFFFIYIFPQATFADFRSEVTSYKSILILNIQTEFHVKRVGNFTMHRSTKFVFIA